MSHLATLELEVKDLDVVKQVCKDNGWTFKEGQQTHKWYGTFVGDSPLPKGIKREDLGKCSHAIGMPGTSWEVGLVAQKKGGYKLAYDFWGTEGGVLKSGLGENGGTFRQSYAVAQATAKAKKLGYNVARATTETGAVRLTITGRFA